MEQQRKLFEKEFSPEPEVRIVRNTFMTAGGLVREEVIRKTWFIPSVE